MAVQSFTPYESGSESFEYVAYEGQVVAIDSTYLGDCDSAYYAVVWAGGSFEQVGLGYTPAGAEVDAPEDLMALYRSWKEAKAALANVESSMVFRGHLETDERLAQFAPTKGKTVKVVKGRKVPKGTVGVVKVNCDGQWGRRVLLALADGSEEWTSAENVEVDLLASAAAPQGVAA